MTSKNKRFALAKRFGYIIFIFTAVAGLYDFYTLHLAQSMYGKPNSIEVEAAVLHLERTSALIILAAPIGFILLCAKMSNVYGAMFYFLLLFAILCNCTIALVRALFWVSSTETEQIYDMQNYSLQFFESTKSVSLYLRKVQQEDKCCGIEGYLEWIIIFGMKKVPDSCCMKKKRKCGRKAFLDLDSLIAVHETEDSGFIPVLNEIHFQQAKVKIPIFREIQPNDVEELNSSLIVESLDAYINLTNFNPCNTSLPHQAAFFYLRKDYSKPIVANEVLDPTFVYSFRAINTRDLCRETNETRHMDELEYEAWSFEKRSVLYVKGCRNYAVEYTNTLCNVVIFHAPILAGFICLMMFLFHCYYWEYRRVQIINEPLPYWFEKLNKDDNVQLLGIGKKESLEELKTKRRNSSAVRDEKYAEARETAIKIARFSTMIQAQEMAKQKQRMSSMKTSVHSVHPMPTESSHTAINAPRRWY